MRWTTFASRSASLSHHALNSAESWYAIGVRTFSNAVRHPNVRAVSNTFRTWSGRARAFCNKFIRACSTFIFSVPTLMTECVVRTSKPPGGALGFLIFGEALMKGRSGLVIVGVGILVAAAVAFQLLRRHFNRGNPTAA